VTCARIRKPKLETTTSNFCSKSGNRSSLAKHDKFNDHAAEESSSQHRSFVRAASEADVVVVMSALALTSMRACAVAPASAVACVVTHSIANAQNAAPSQRRRARCIKAWKRAVTLPTLAAFSWGD